MLDELGVRSLAPLAFFVSKPSRDADYQHFSMPDLGTNVRQRTLASTVVGGDCYSLGYSPVPGGLDQTYLVLKSVSTPTLSLGCHIEFVAKSFDPNFYIVCATVIPVLFLAVAVQGSAYKTVLEAAMTAARTKASDGWTHQLRALALSRTLQLIGYAIWCAGALGELLALMVLYQDHEDSGTRIIVFLATVFLTFVAGAGPLSTYTQVRSAIWRQRGTLPDDLPETESIAARQPDQPNTLSPQPSDP